MARYMISEDSGASEVREAESLDDALSQAREWSADGDYDERVMVTCYAVEIDDDGDPIGDRVSAEVMAGPEPEEPECIGDEDHDWQGEGGCESNPGVWSLGGTAMRYDERCTRCGWRRITHTSGAQRNPGELPQRVEYEAPSL